jgi:hypothetical protein
MTAAVTALDTVYVAHLRLLICICAAAGPAGNPAALLLSMLRKGVLYDCKEQTSRTLTNELKIKLTQAFCS